MFVEATGVLVCFCFRYPGDWILPGLQYRRHIRWVSRLPLRTQRVANGLEAFVVCWCCNLGDVATTNITTCKHDLLKRSIRAHDYEVGVEQRRRYLIR